jgi:hypothetical protein
VHDLAPMVQFAPYDADLKLDAAEAARLSPVLLAPRTHAPLVLAAGADESSEFIRQTRLLWDAWPRNRPAGARGRCSSRSQPLQRGGRLRGRRERAHVARRWRFLAPRARFAAGQRPGARYETDFLPAASISSVSAARRSSSSPSRLVDRQRHRRGRRVVGKVGYHERVALRRTQNRTLRAGRPRLQSTSRRLRAAPMPPSFATPWHLSRVVCLEHILSPSLTSSVNSRRSPRADRSALPARQRTACHLRLAAVIWTARLATRLRTSSATGSRPPPTRTASAPGRRRRRKIDVLNP